MSTFKQLLMELLFHIYNLTKIPIFALSVTIVRLADEHPGGVSGLTILLFTTDCVLLDVFIPIYIFVIQYIERIYIYDMNYIPNIPKIYICMSNYGLWLAYIALEWRPAWCPTKFYKLNIYCIHDIFR